VLFTYLHLAASEGLTRALAESGAACVAYETVETDNRALPLLAPMSEIAAGSLRRPARTSSRSRSVAGACCSAASPALRPVACS
jgi:alanine dehydrogenase